MNFEESKGRIRSWADQLIGKELQYITKRNSVVINSVDWSEGGKLIVTRSDEIITINNDRIDFVLKELLKGLPIHIDTLLRSSGNDRSVIETIFANFPPIGFMKAHSGRNHTQNKVIQWLNKDIHILGEIKDTRIQVRSATLFISSN